MGGGGDPYVIRMGVVVVPLGFKNVVLVHLALYFPFNLTKQFGLYNIVRKIHIMAKKWYPEFSTQTPCFLGVNKTRDCDGSLCFSSFFFCLFCNSDFSRFVSAVHMNSQI